MKAADLLKIDMNLIQGLSIHSNEIVDLQRERILHQNDKKLKRIEESMLTDKEIQVSDKSVESVIQRVLFYTVNKDMTPDLNASELRIISYYLSRLQGNDAAFDFAIKILKINWRDLYISGLAFYVLNSWNSIREDYKSKVCGLLRHKLIEYSGKIKRYQLLSNHADYFDENGPVKLATFLYQRQIKLEDGPIILGYKPSTLSWSFYSDVIVKFILSNGVANEEEVETILERHGLDRTKKLVFANLIIRAEKAANSNQQMRLGRFASRIIGDVSLASTWAPFTGATNEDVNKLRQAKELVNLWYSRIIIEVFFEVSCQDLSRRKFWMNYVNDIEDFRVAGSTVKKNELRNDPRSRDMYSKFFIDTSSEVSQTAALILCIKDKVFVEFSDTGALHVYKHDRSQLKSIQRGNKFIEKVEDLKTKDIPLLVETSNGYYYLNEEGRLHHRGEWEKRLEIWMEHYMSSSNTAHMSFSRISDDKVFIAQPITDKAPVLKDDYNPPKSNISSSNSIGLCECAEGFSMASKWIAEDRCRVVANQTGYYIQFKSGQIVKLVNLSSREPVSGNIWIRKARVGGWRQIVHESEYESFIIGYINELIRILMFKDKLNTSNIKQISIE